MTEGRAEKVSYYIEDTREIRALSKAEFAAAEKRAEAKRNYEKRVRKRVADAERKAREEFAGLAEEVVALARLEDAAKHALEDERVRVAMKHPHIGVTVEEWKSSGYGFRPSEPHRTGRRGIIRVWTREEKCPANITYSEPRVGSLFVRLLKKDGTESLQFDTLGGYNGQWRVVEGTKSERTS